MNLDIKNVIGRAGGFSMMSRMLCLFNEGNKNGMGEPEETFFSYGLELNWNVIRR